MLDFPSFPSIDLRELKTVQFDLQAGRTAKALRTFVAVLTRAIENPGGFAPVRIWLGDERVKSEDAGSPPPREGKDFYGEGEGGWVTIALPHISDAQHCLEIAQRLLAIVDDGQPCSPREVINDALHFGVLLSCVLPWYDGSLRVRLEAKEKAARISEAQAHRASQGSRLTEAQWGAVSSFIAEKTSGGVSAAEACRQAAARLNTGAFSGIAARISISAEAIRKRWSKRNSPT
jgi:hypothetical protein